MRTGAFPDRADETRPWKAAPVRHHLTVNTVTKAGVRHLLMP